MAGPCLLVASLDMSCRFGSLLLTVQSEVMHTFLSSSAPGCMPDGSYPHTLPSAPPETSYDEDWEVFDP